MRGKHNNRPRKLTGDQIELVVNHIRSYKGPSSHYSQNKTTRVYLTEELNITKMFEQFREQSPASTTSYESYRKIFNNKFNISFGYPRSDTCSTCERLAAKPACLDSEIQAGAGDAPAHQEERHQANVEKELHQRKAQVFYDRKKAAKRMAQQDPTTLAVAFDFQKELPLPNKTTSDVFYRRQLSVHSFNIHELAGDNAYIYVYNETVARRGSDDVASLLLHFFNNFVPDTVKHLHLFCDGCPGQNKNWTLIRFLFGQVHFTKRFDSIKLFFPIRGHSYMECDRDLSMVNKRRGAELQEHWVEEFRSARKKPSPFNMIEPTQEVFLAISEHLKPVFKATCPIPTRPVRELSFRVEDNGVFGYRNCWNGKMETAVALPRHKSLPQKVQACIRNSPKPLYSGPLSISTAKFADLQVLKQFCDPRNANFYDLLPTDGAVPNSLHQELSDSESDSE